jgi:hypothetical protein
MRQLLTLFSLIFSCVAVCSKLSAQDAFTSNRLNELFAQLPLDCKNALSRSTENKCNCNIKGNAMPIKASFNTQGQLSHLGLDLFSFDANLIYPNTVLSFLERCYLEFLVWDDPTMIERKNKEDKIALLINEKLFNNPGTEKLHSILPILLSNEKDLNILQDSLYYQAIITSPKGKATLLFAANYQVVSGMDKKEYAEELIQSLKTYQAKGYLFATVDEARLKPYRDELKVNIGKDYFKTISSNTYFKCSGNDCNPIFDSQYPLESFINAFLISGNFNQDVYLSIDQKIYANEKAQYEVKLFDFVAYFQNDYELYFGIENNSENLLEGTLIILNRHLNFINLLHVSSEPQAFFKTGKRVLNAKFYTNIPSDNIKNLFAEKGNTNKR